MRFSTVLSGPVLSTEGATATLVVWPADTVNADQCCPQPADRSVSARRPPVPDRRWGGLLIGQGTRWNVESTTDSKGGSSAPPMTPCPVATGRNAGWTPIRPSGMFKINVEGPSSRLRTHATPFNALCRARRGRDLIWRHRPAAAPIAVPTDEPAPELDRQRVIVGTQASSCAPPTPALQRQPREVVVPVAPAGAVQVPVVSAINAGNARAYPSIRIDGPTSGEPVSRIELVNATADVTFDVATTLPSRSVLVGDMEARVTAAPRSVITLDGQSKYGSWQFPRDAFFLAPDPQAQGGVNALYLRTTPGGAPVTCSLTWSDTWSG